MPALDDILKNFALFVDGRGYAGNVEEVNPPKLTRKTEEMRNGGMDASYEVDLGMEKLELSFTLSSYDKNVLALFGLAPGNAVPLTLRGALESADGTNTPVVINMRGELKETDPGSWKPGTHATLKGTVSLSYYKYTQGGSVLHEIDVFNMVRVIGGVDQLAAMRSNLGI